MFAAFLTRLGFTRDMPMWLWLRIVSLATILLSLTTDQIHQGLTFVGLTISDVWLHRLIALAAAVLWIAGKQDHSTLPSKAEKQTVSLPVHKGVNS